MTKTETRESYRKRIERVLEFIASHDGDALDIHRLAEEAHFSPYHFHRIYVAMMGETVAGTARRRRLHNAAVKLVSSASPIARIAHESGYGSVQAFNRVFREGYGVTPNQYRQHGQVSHAINRTQLNHRKENTMFQLTDVNVAQLPRVNIFALRHLGDYQNIGATFEKLAIWAASKGVPADQQRSFGIYYDDPISKPPQD